MNILKLKNNNPNEQNVLNIINHIKDIETAKGLTEDDIKYKYTHGYCSSLVEMVKHFLPECKSICFWSCEEFAHFCIAIERGVNKNKSYEDLYYYDINGKHTYNTMREWLAKQFNGKIEGIFVKEIDVSRSNEIENDVYSTICIENENMQML